MTHTDKLLWISRQLLLTSGCVRKTSMNHLLIKGEIVLIADEKHRYFFFLLTSKASTCWFSFSIPVLSNSFMLAITTSWRSTSHASLIYFSVDSTEAPLPVCSKNKHNNRLWTRSRQHLEPVSVRRVTNVHLFSFCSFCSHQNDSRIEMCQ